MIRYEVIYKNTLRDLRKYFSTNFNSTTEWPPKSRDPTVILKVLKAYTANAFSNELLVRHGVTRDELAFCMGSLIKPKQMINCSQRQSPEIHASVVKIYYYLYKFSLQRLQELLDSKAMVLIMCHYLSQARLSGRVQ
jgi:hypothetical protein